jgi:asparagine synthase (glutamine-hydrolysing)
MAHSLELRTPLVDAALLKTLGPFVSSFAGGAGKAMLARSPKKHLFESIINRPKTGFTIPMAKWLSNAAKTRACDNPPLLSSVGTPWARRWARRVIEEVAAGKQEGPVDESRYVSQSRWAMR